MSTRYLFDGIIGDGGEFIARAYPENICDPNDKPKETQHGFSAWIKATSSIHAVGIGTSMAAEYFKRLDREDEERRLTALRAKSDLYREPPTGGEW